VADFGICGVDPSICDVRELGGWLSGLLYVRRISSLF
jgi:hypothetical protein